MVMMRRILSGFTGDACFIVYTSLALHVLGFSVGKKTYSFSLYFQNEIVAVCLAYGGVFFDGGYFSCALNPCALSLTNNCALSLLRLFGAIRGQQCNSGHYFIFVQELMSNVFRNGFYGGNVMRHYII